jgi:hypothetical protein
MSKFPAIPAAAILDGKGAVKSVGSGPVGIPGGRAAPRARSGLAGIGTQLGHLKQLPPPKCVHGGQS